MINKQVPSSPKQRKSILDAFDIRLLGRSKSRQQQQQHESIKKASSSTTIHKSNNSDSSIQDDDQPVLHIPFVNHSPPPTCTDDNSEASKLSAVNLVSNISTAQNWLDLQESDDGGSTDVLKPGSRRAKAKSMVMNDDRATTSSIKRNRSWSKIGTRRSRSRSLRSPPPPPDDTQDTPPSLPNVDIQQIRNELIDASRGSTKKRRERRKSTHATDQHLTDNIITNVRHKLGLGSMDDKKSQRESHKRTLSSGSIRSITRTTSTSTRQRRRSTTGISSSSSSSSRLMPLQKNRSQHDLAVNTHLTPPIPPLPTRSSSSSTINSKIGKSMKKPSSDDTKSTAYNNSGISTCSEDNSGGDIDTSSQHSLQTKRGESSLRKGAMSLWKRMSFSDQKQKDTTAPLEHAQPNADGKSNNPTKKNRRRGKTLPGSLAPPPPPPVLAPPLPPMKMEPLSMNIPKPATTPHEQTPKPSKHVDMTVSRPAGVKKSFSAAPTPFTALNNDNWIETPAHELCGGDTTTHPLPIVPSSSTGSSSLASSKKTTATTPTTITDGATQNRKPLEPWKSKSLPEMNKHGKRQEIPEQEPLSPQLRPQAMFNDSLESITQIPPLHPEAASTDISLKSVDHPVPGDLCEKLESLIAQNHVSDKDQQDIEELCNWQQSKPPPRRRRLSEADIHQVSLPSSRKERTPKTCQVVLRYYSQYLSEYEQHELLDYDHIYFFGPHARKVKGRPNDPVLNYGYDDERGDYRLVVHDQLAYRYEVLERLGQGSFGQVVRCIDHKTGHSVAVKLIRNKRRFQTQALTEVRILRKLVDWDPDDRCHNIRVLDHFYFRNHMCVVFECLSMNLYEFIKINNFSGFKPSLIRRFTMQLISSLCLLYDHRLAHCDLKPENILLKHPNKTSIKVIDFGSSCFEDERVYTYIQSRFYRAPEVILGMAYGTPIDMWSVGCILAELYTGMPIFPGESEQDQLVCIMEVLGVPPPYMVEQSTRRNLFFDLDGRPRPSFSSRGRKRRPGCKPLIHALGGCHDFLFVDFIARCLQWDPAHRLKPYDALHHEWIAQHIKRAEGNISQSSASAAQNTFLVSSQH